ANALLEALEMPESEQKERMCAMRKTVEKFNINHWVKLFMERLKEIKNMQRSLATRQITSTTFDVILNKYTAARRRIFFLDYDGTLVGFNVDPLKARPDKELFNLLDQLLQDERNRVILISGRMYETLDEWFGHLPLDIIAEHGAWTKKHNQSWKRYHGLSDDWNQEIMP